MDLDDQNRFRWMEDAQPAGKWLNSPAFCFESTLQNVGWLIPSFERIPFSFGGSDSAANLRLDTIIRNPYLSDHSAVPVGVVSKEYSLVSHKDILARITKFVVNMKLNPSDLKAELKLTEYGERMQLSVILPENFSFKGANDESMSLRLECFNSVEGSMRFQAMVGWFRFVCSNGLVIGVTKSSMKRRHTSDLQIEDLDEVLQDGIKDAERNMITLQKWQSQRIDIAWLAKWSDQHIKASFGFKAAARFCHIARTGRDGTIAEAFTGREPSNIRMESANFVPGSSVTASTLYDASQILAWLAKERKDIQEQVEWRRQIPDLMKLLEASVG
ncbi:MAG: DUF932 domain-containing protein [Fibrobacteres bacterium]|nr:DUF932 domain-containing protein [Fibrobacterota bacterium]